MGREEIYTNMFANFMDLSIKDKLLLDFDIYRFLKVKLTIKRS